MYNLKEPSAPPRPRERRRRRRRNGRIVGFAAAGAVLLVAGAGTAAVLVLDGGDAPADRPAVGKPDPKAAAGGTKPGKVTPRPTARGPVVNGRRQPAKVRVPVSASGRYGVVPGTARAPGGRSGSTVRYMVEVERGLPFRGAQFAAEVHRVLNDPRSWGHGGAMRFVRVAKGPVRFRVSLSSPALTDRLCLPLRTGGELSCRSGSRSIINARRWGIGAVTYGGDLATYREYVVNHEVGHALGHGHQNCPGAGRRAPVMVQQTKSLYGCRTNAWPFPKG